MRRTLALVCAMIASAARAAGPFITDDAGVLDQGRCQVEAFTRSETAYAGSEEWLLPACNFFGPELTLGRNRIEGENRTIVQAKFPLRPLERGRPGFALSLGSFGGDPYVNGIASFPLAREGAAVHANLGMIRHADADHGTWGVGIELPLPPPRWSGVVESFGERGAKPTLQLGIRFGLVEDRLQLSATSGHQGSRPERRFYSFGVRASF